MGSIMKSAKYNKLSRLFDHLESALSLDRDEDKYVIFSDQHIGMPEFDHNKELYLKALEYYFNSGYRLIIDGDY